MTSIQNKMTVSCPHFRLNMIVKNETNAILECLASVKIDLACYFAAQAVAIPEPDDILFVDMDVYQ